MRMRMRGGCLHRSATYVSYLPYSGVEGRWWRWGDCACVYTGAVFMSRPQVRAWAQAHDMT
jgi:hypothetical protein